MPSNLKVIQSHNFTGGMTSDLAPEVMEPNQYRYMLNCNVLSTSEGNVGILTNVKGTVEIPVPLPDGTNKTIGWCADEEKNNLYFFVYNSLGYHGIYRYNSVDNAVIKVMECITDTGDEDIFGWDERDLIIQANVVENNLLYWCVRGEERHPPRKINISKALDRTETGYNGFIREEYTRAYKRTVPYPPKGAYFTNPDKKFNRVYGRLFKFAVRFGYDDKEWSNWSSFSDVPVPDFELYTGSLSVPDTNNGIHVSFGTGGLLVKRIEVAMMCTNPDGGVLPWVSIEVLNKEDLNIPDNSDYTYEFYNDVATSPIGDQQKVFRLYSYLPKDPRCQDFVEKAIVYANFHEGFPVVDVDVETSVRYEDLFIDADEENELNNPSITVINQSTGSRSRWVPFKTERWRYVQGTLVIGEDVKKGNTFTFILYDGMRNPNYTVTVTATASDDAKTIASKFAAKFREILTNSQWGGFEYVTTVTEDLSGNASFDFRYWGWINKPTPTIATSQTAVETNSLKNAGQSINNIKLGSSVGYAIVYMDEDGRKSAAYRTEGMTVAIDSINTLGGLKKPIVELAINHTPPEWAYSYQIVRTDDLVYGNYIQMLIQKTVNYTKGSDEYIDLVVGSLFTYQSIHPNTTLTYEFKKGDRVRLVKEYDGADWVIPAEAKDFEVIGYYPVVEQVMDQNVTVDGTSTVAVGSASPDHIGSYIRVNGSEREIISVTDGTHYEISDTLDTGDPNSTEKTFPSYEIINRRGVIRIKNDPDNPIEADPDNDIFPLVEVYSPAVGGNTADEDMFSEFGLVLPIINPGTATAYHSGTVQDQDASQGAMVDISSGTSYVRYRELPVNNDINNTQVIVSEVEDPSYSDFYVSDMNGNGKRIPLDRGDGEVLFDERVRFSNNYIEGTRINGLNDFDNLDRVDYNDKYGAIERLWYEEGKLIVFKHLKDTWTPVYASIITDQGGNPLLAKSDRLLDDKLQYYSWDGGVGDNPESVARLGTNFFHVSPNSMIVARIGGNGVDDISRIYSLDKDVRDHLTSAKKAQAHIYGGTDRKNGKYDVIIEKHDNVISDTPISESGWINEVEELPTSGVTYSLVSGPSHGTANVSGSVIDYTPDSGYSGPDTMQYEVFVNGVSQGVRNVCLTVVYQAGPPAWRPISQFCVLNDGARTGYKGWNTLEQYDTYHGNTTGVTKPNLPDDPDYVAPVYDIAACSPQEQFILFSTTSTNSSYGFDLGTGVSQVIVEARVGGVAIDTSSLSSSQSKTLNLSGNTGTAQILVRGSVGVSAQVISVVSDSNNVVSENMSAFPNVEVVHFRDNDLTTLTVNPTYNPELISLAYNDNNVSVFNPSGFQNLDAIDGRNNGINSMVFDNLPVLRSIAFNNNNFTSINTDNLPLLEWVEMTFNNLTQAGFDFTPNPLIKTLLLASNPGITAFDPSQAPNVTWLTIDRTDITSIDMTLLPDIQSLDITQCPIPAFNISTNDDLTDLRCGECTFTDDSADPSIVDAVIIKMDSNITSGGTLHYDTLTPLGVQPTNASRAAYDSLVLKGTDLQGKVPLP